MQDLLNLFEWLRAFYHLFLHGGSRACFNIGKGMCSMNKKMIYNDAGTEQFPGQLLYQSELGARKKAVLGRFGARTRFVPCGDGER
jgi:hypothetical protein